LLGSNLLRTGASTLRLTAPSRYEEEVAALPGKLQNLGPMVILKSPLHRIMSDAFLVLQWTGRTSGRTFATPVSYVRGENNSLLITSDSGWVHNFTAGAPVRLWLRGQRVTAHAELVSDTEAAAEALYRMVLARPSYAKNAGIAPGPERVVDLEACRVATATRRLVRLTI
jgi:deazaflavin-dependent oxidoreductase (nitroreductase family)